MLERFSTLKWKRANKTDWQQTNGNRAICLVYWTDTNTRMKKLHARELSRNQSILHFDVILQHNWPIEQCLLLIRVFFGGKTKSPCFDLFIHWLIKQITNAYWNYFSKSYENRSNCVHIHSAVGSMIKEGCRWRIRKPSSLSVLKVVEASLILQVTSKSLEKHDSLKICILSFYMFHQALLNLNSLTECVDRGWLRNINFCNIN